MAAAGPTPAPRPTPLLWVVLGVILTDVWRLHDLVPATRALRPSVVLTLLGLLLFAVGGNVARTLGALRSPITALVAVFVGLILVGMPFSLDPAQSAQAFRSTVVPHLLAGFLVAVSVRNVRDAEFLALGTLVGAFAHTLFVHLTAPIGVEGRWVMLPHYDVNDLALMLVVMIPITMYFMRRRTSTGRRLFAVVCFALFTYSIVPTGSRGGFIGLAVVLAYLLLRYKAIPRRARIAGAAAALLALAVGGEAFLHRIETIVQPGTDYNWSEETGRLAIWERGRAYVADRPLFGVGLNQFRTAERRSWRMIREARMTGRSAPPARGAHNTLLQVAAELGLPALAVFLTLLGATWRGLTRLRDASGPPDASAAALGNALAASLLGYFVCGLFLHAAFFPVLPMLLGFAAALVATYGARLYVFRLGRGGLVARRDLPREVAV